MSQVPASNASFLPLTSINDTGSVSKRACGNLAERGEWKGCNQRSRRRRMIWYWYAISMRRNNSKSSPPWRCFKEWTLPNSYSVRGGIMPLSKNLSIRGSQPCGVAITNYHIPSHLVTLGVWRKVNTSWRSRKLPWWCGQSLGMA